jgi:hypothetical protein
VRLSEDDGPPAHSFLGDDDDQEGEVGAVGEEDNDSGNRRESTPLVPSVGLQRSGRLVEVTGLEDVPPVPPPKDLT